MKIEKEFNKRIEQYNWKREYVTRTEGVKLERGIFSGELKNMGYSCSMEGEDIIHFTGTPFSIHIDAVTPEDTTFSVLKDGTVIDTDTWSTEGLGDGVKIAYFHRLGIHQTWKRP